MDRISALREQMKLHHIDAYIIPSTDPHLSEYPASRWKSRAWVSGFTGSAGTVVITSDKAGLWTDSRYFIQAETELTGTGINLYRQGLPDTPSYTEFLIQTLSCGSTVGFDAQCFGAGEAQNLIAAFKRKKINIESSYDLIEAIWKDRPSIPQEPFFAYPAEYAGATTEEKLNRVNNALHQAGADCTVLCTLDEIAWTFNIRGTDVSYNPVVVSYAFVSENENVLFVEREKLEKETADALMYAGVIIADYNKIIPYLNNLKEDTIILVDKAKTNLSVYNAIPQHCTKVETASPVALLKSVKNETELKGFRNAMVKDGISLTKFFMWLEASLAGGEPLTEIQITEQLTAFRSEQPFYVSDSFGTICGYNEHGAIVHYSATPETASVVRNEGMLLIDSGAQYFDGTTDITRTVALGEPNEAMIKDFTRVLKGHISLGKCKFPQGTRGSQLDILARKALWDNGLNYLHGTGHGIGHFLNVHEGPQSIRMDENPVTLQPGMVLSNEPGLYRTGEYGIRIENLIRVQEDSETEFGKFYSFETLTLFPIDRKLIDPAMLSVRERAWLNKYHQFVFDTLTPHLNADEQAWLKQQTAEI